MDRKMNALIDCTPKCHCELAGEGIKYWGCTNYEYYHQPLSAKKKKHSRKHLENVQKTF
jgi:hypothetical protein